MCVHPYAFRGYKHFRAVGVRVRVIRSRLLRRMLTFDPLQRVALVRCPLLLARRHGEVLLETFPCSKMRVLYIQTKHRSGSLRFSTKRYALHKLITQPHRRARTCAHPSAACVCSTHDAEKQTFLFYLASKLCSSIQPHNREMCFAASDGENVACWLNYVKGKAGSIAHICQKDIEETSIEWHKIEHNARWNRSTRAQSNITQHKLQSQQTR